MLLRALDNEALFTLAGGLKPMSTVGSTFTFPVTEPDVAAIAERRRLLSVWRCGTVLSRRPHVPRHQRRETQREQRGVLSPGGRRGSRPPRGFFAPLGLTPGAHPMEVLTAIEWSERGPRWRGQGYLYGYPDYAVDFFVEAGEAEARGGAFVPRDPSACRRSAPVPIAAISCGRCRKGTSRTTRIGRSSIARRGSWPRTPNGAHDTSAPGSPAPLRAQGLVLR